MIRPDPDVYDGENGGYQKHPQLLLNPDRVRKLLGSSTDDPKLRGLPNPSFAPRGDSENCHISSPMPPQF